MFRSRFNEKKKLWSGANIPCVFDTNLSIGNILLRSMRIFGSKTAQISADSGVSLTFNEIRLNTIRAAQNLQFQGYKPKQVIGIMADNSEYLSSIVFASFCSGCPINSLSTSVEKQDVIRMFGITEPSIVFCDVKVYELMKECLNELKNAAKIYTFNGTKGDSEAVEFLFKKTGIEDDFIPVPVDANNDTLAIMSSSGTTGECKGVCLSHSSLIAQVTAFDVATADDIFFSSSSLNWMIGLIVNLLNIFSGATRIITSKPFSPETQFQIIKDYKVSVVIGQSYYIIECLKSGHLYEADLSSVKHMIVAGYKLPLSAINEFNKFLPNGTLNNSYGLTETSGYVAVDYPQFSGNDSVGRLMSGYSVKIVDKDGNRCGVDVDGEICIKAPRKFIGYANNEKLTAQALDDEGYVLTGDIGRMDKNGNLYIDSRKKDVIIYHHTIIPTDVEEILIVSPHIRGVCVVGVTDESTIELPAAVVVRAKDSTITEKDICDIVGENMPDYCKLRGGVYFVDAIPTTPSGKVIRRLAKEIATKLFNANTVKGA